MEANGNFWKYVSIGVHLTSECEEKRGRLQLILSGAFMSDEMSFICQR